MTDKGIGEPIDGTQTDLEAAEASDTGEALDDEALDDEALDDEELDDEALDDEEPLEEQLDEDDEIVEPEPAPERRRRRPDERRAEQARANRGLAMSSRARGVAIDPSLRIRDRVSQAFVILVVLVYLAIFLNAMAFGHGGAFTTTPQPTVASSESASPGASGSSAPAASPQGS